MIRLFILLMIAAVVLSLAVFQFKAIPMKRKMAVAGGAVAAAFIGVLMQSVFAWYLSVLAIVAVSLLASLVYMKELEKEETEKARFAEERKAKRQTLIPAAPAEVQVKEEVQTEESKAIKVRETIKEPNVSKEREIIKEPETIKVRETIQVSEPKKEPDTIKERETVKEPETIKIRETIQARETIKEPKRELETVPAKPVGMQSIQPVGKER